VSIPAFAKGNNAIELLLQNNLISYKLSVLMAALFNSGKP
jgi:hypothetical protein